MSVWGKLGGGSLGLAVGGPIGALIGAFTGHYLVDRPSAPFGAAPPDVLLSTGLVALSAKMAKADGVVLDVEIQAFKQVVHVDPADAAKVDRLFALASTTTAGFEAYAGQLAAAFRSEPTLLDDVIDGLFLIAKADGAIHEAEARFVADVARIFGRSDDWFETALARHAQTGSDPYRLLGADRSWDDDRLRRHYRQLVRELHPDREIARGLPPEAIRIATDRLAAVNAAWDLVARERGL